MRIATVMTPKNVDELENIADWVPSLGIASYAISPVINIGRAMEQDNNNKDNQLFFTDNESYLKFQNVLIAINEKYPNFIILSRMLISWNWAK